MLKRLPFIVFLLFIILVWKMLSTHSAHFADVLINKRLPAFSVYTLDKNELTDKSLLGQVTLLHIWAPWCSVCRAEYPKLNDIKAKYNITMVGIVYRDSLLNTRQWISVYGQPFDQLAVDEKGSIGVALGITGVPETFVIDKNAVVRYRQLGDIHEEDWNEHIWPLIQQLQKS